MDQRVLLLSLKTFPLSVKGLTDPPDPRLHQIWKFLMSQYPLSTLSSRGHLTCP